MAHGPLRFIHAGGLHLERPLSGVTEVPDHLRDLFVEAPYQAARRIFDAALDQRVDFVIVVGELLSPWGAGPRGALFLADQFRRLAERQIGVYWLCGTTDGWPAGIDLPENVHRFARPVLEETWYERDGVRRARLLGCARYAGDAVHLSDVLGEPSGTFTVALVHTGVAVPALDSPAVEYWALGGRTERYTPQTGPQTAHDPGISQGSCPDEPGPHGCTLVQVESSGRIELQTLGTDVARWENEQLSLDAHITRADLEQLLRQRIGVLREAGSTHTRLVSWNILGAGPLMSQLRRGSLATELVESLRRSYGFESPVVWTTSLKAESTASLPAHLFEEDSLLGDFLRVTRDHAAADADLWRFEREWGEKPLAGTAVGLLAVSDEETRQRVLRRATALGVDLLSGEDLER